MKEENVEKEVLVFSIDNQYYGIDVLKVMEIMIPRDLTPIPKANKYVDGIFKPRENVITVLNLPKYLNSKNPDNVRLFIVIETKDGLIALKVDNVLGMVKYEKALINNPLNETGTSLGLLEADNTIINVFDIDSLIEKLTD